MENRVANPLSFLISVDKEGDIREHFSDYQLLSLSIGAEHLYADIVK